MKKFLSLVLALAMIISCVSMVSFTASAEEEIVGVLYTAAQDIPAQTKIYANRAAGFTVDDAVDGVITKSYVVYNPNKYPINVNLYYQDGWTSLGTVEGGVVNANLNIGALKKATATFTIPVAEDGTVTYSSGTKTTTIDKIALRVDIPGSNPYAIPAGTQFFIEAPAGDVVHSIGAGSKYNDATSFTKTSVTEYPDMTYPMGDGTLEEDASWGWGTIHGGSFSAVADPADANNTVAKLTASGYAYDSIFFDFGPYIFNDPDFFYAGHGKGAYKISFKYKAEAESLEGYTGNAQFDVTINSQNHLSNAQVQAALPDATYTHDTYYMDSNFITMTTEWQTYTHTFTFDEAYDMLVDLRHNSVANTGKQALTYQFGLRLDGSGTKAFKDSQCFNYFIDDVKIEYVGTKLGFATEITTDYPDTDYPYWRNGSIGLTEANAVDKVITLSYDIYNTGKTEIVPEIQIQNDYSSTNCPKNSVTLPAGKKTTLDVKIYTDGNGNYVKADGKTVICALSALTFRFNYNSSGSRAAGSACVLAPKNDLSASILYAMSKTANLGGSNGGVATASDYIALALPDYEKVEAPAAPAPVPVAVGLKLTSNTGLTAATYFNGGKLAAATGFTGTKEYTYKIHNVADQAVVVNMSVQTLHDGGWRAATDSETEVTIPADSFMIVTSTATVTNGKVVVSGTEYDLSACWIRINQTYSAGAQEGDGIIIEAPIGDPLYNGSGSKVTKSEVYELPVYLPHELVNGDVSIGDIGDTDIEGWTTWNGGSSTIIQDPADENNKVIKFVPTQEYSTTGFKVAPVVYNDGIRYFGNGIGVYTITLRARLEDASYLEGLDEKTLAKANSFAVSLCGQKVYSHNNEANSYNTNSKTIHLTGDWQTFTITIPVRDNNYNGWVAAADGANVFVRLDASGTSSAFKYTGEFAPVNYLIDDVTIEYKGVMSGYLFEKSGANYYVNSNGSVFTSEDVVNNYITSTQTFYNPNDYDISLEYCVQGTIKTTTGDSGWHGYSESALIKPGHKATLTVKVPVDPETGKAIITANAFEGRQDVALSSLFMRVNLNPVGDTAAPNGTQFVLEADYNETKATKFASWNHGYIGITPDFNIVGADLEIGSTLTINYYATLGEGYEDATMNFARNEQETPVEGVLVTEGDYAGYYKFAYTGINPQAMGDNIEAYLVLDGQDIAVLKRYSVKDYALNMYGTQDNAELDTLLADMLAYGAASQTYTGYNDDKLVNADITWATSEFAVPTTVRNVVGNTDADAKVYSVGMNISNVYKLYFKLQIAEGTKYTVKLNGDDVTGKVDGGVLYTDDIKATGNATVYTLELLKDGSLVTTVTYSVDSYIAAKYNSESVGAIVQAISNYGVSAYNYAN